MMKKIFLLLFCVFLAFPVSADPDVDLIIERFGKVLKFPNLSGTVKVKMISKKGDVREIEADAFQKAISKDQLNILFQFQYPPTVRDTSLLIHTFFNGKPNNMWIYLPAVKRIKRIALEQSGGGYFMGSDFTYADFIMKTQDDYEREYLGDIVIEGRDCYIIKDWAASLKQRQDLGYAYTVNYYSKDDYFLYARDYYDLSENLLKTYRVKEIFNYGTSIYPTEIVMHNVQSDHKSILSFHDYSAEKDIPENIFTTRYLRR